MWVVVFAVFGVSDATLVHPLQGVDNTLLLQTETLFGSSLVEVSTVVDLDCRSGGLRVGSFSQHAVGQSQSGVRVDNVTVRDYVYLDYMHHPVSTVGTVNVGQSDVQINVCDFPELTFISDFYNRSALFFGPPNDAVKSRIKVLPTVQVGSSSTPSGTRLQIRFGAQPLREVLLSMSLWDHKLSDPTFCGSGLLYGPDGRQSLVRVDIPCTNATTGTLNVLSVYRLGLGAYLNRRDSYELTLYSVDPRDSDLLTCVFILTSIFLFTTVWTRFTENVTFPMNKDDRIEVWRIISDTYVILNADVAVMCTSLAVWSAMQHRHNNFNFATMDMLGIDRALVALQTLSYGYLPGLLCCVLGCLAYGNATYGEMIAKDKALFFSWDIDWLSKQSFLVRCSLTAVPLVVFTSLVVAFWLVLFDSVPLAVLSGLGVFVVILWYSNTSVAKQSAQTRLPKFEDDTKTLILLRWSMEVILFVTMSGNVPYSVSENYSLEFHDGIVISLAVVMLLVTGRDGKLVWISAQNTQDARVMGWWALVVLWMAGGVILYTSLFGIGSLFSSSSAFRNRPDSALLASASFSTWLFSTVFATTG